MHSGYAHQQRPVGATLFRFHIECYMYAGYIKLFVVLGNLTDLCLTWTWSYAKNLSGKQRVWIQIRQTFDTSGEKELKEFVFRMGYAASFSRFLMRGSRIFCQLGGGGGSKPY